MLSGLGTVYGLYSQRYIAWNRFKKQEYLKPGERTTVGELYSHRIRCPKAEVEDVTQLLYRSRSSFFKRLGCGDEEREVGLPSWLSFHRGANMLKGTPVVEDSEPVVLRVTDKDRHIREQFRLDVGLFDRRVDGPLFLADVGDVVHETVSPLHTAGIVREVEVPTVNPRRI